ncbi:MAG: hypothetical protein K2Q10_03475 [Rhodospirillales bacterium]|nr:hypothetical protein [Rhodospirillales bacterium]
MTRISVYLGNHDAIMDRSWFQDVVLTFKGAMEECGLTVFLSNDTLRGDTVNLLLPPFSEDMADWLGEHPNIAYGILAYDPETEDAAFRRIAAAARFVWALPGSALTERRTELAWGHAAHHAGILGGGNAGGAILLLQNPTPRQEAVLSVLMASNLPVKVVPERFPLYLRDDLIAHCLCCLALKPTEEAAVPFPPMLLAPLAAGCPVIVETDNATGFSLAEHCLAIPLAEVTATCLALVQDAGCRAEAVRRARRFAHDNRLSHILAPVLKSLIPFGLRTDATQTVSSPSGV